MNKVAALLISAALTVTLVQPALARSASRETASGLQPHVSYSLHHDLSAPLQNLITAAAAQPQPQAQHTVPLRPLLPTGAHAPRTTVRDGALQTYAGPKVQATIGLNLEGVSANAPNPCFCAPPDTEGVVGATQYVQWVNSAISVFDKSTGAKIVGPVPGNILWSGFGGVCQTTNQGDPIVQYDKAAQRWVFTQFAFNVDSTGTPVAPFMQCVAVSTSSNVLSAYNRYAFNYSILFNDYPKLGIWPDAYYVTYNIFYNFSGPYLGALACALDRNAMLAGLTAKQVCFLPGPAATPNGLLPADLDGATPPPAGSPEPFLGLNTPGTSVSGNTLNLWRFHVDFATPANSTFTGPISLPVAPYTIPCGTNFQTCIPQAGTSNTLDSLGDRLMYRLAYRNILGHESLVVNHSVQLPFRIGVRWYEVRDPNGTPTVYQQGTFSPDIFTSRWMGSIAMDKVGDILLGYSASGYFMHPAVRYTGRVPSDPLNTMEAEATIVQGNGSQTSPNRWGDYSAMTIDPVDDCTFWYTQEYLQSTGTTWNTRIASLKFPSCQ